MREVAGGAMGVVFEARHKRLDHRVALKVLRPEMATAVAAERFLAEGRILARLSHPSIVRVYDAGEMPASSSAPDGAGSLTIMLKVAPGRDPSFVRTVDCK